MKNVKWHNGLMIWIALLLSVPEKHIAQDSPVVSYLANYYEMLNNYGDTTLSLPDRILFQEEILTQYFFAERSLIWNDLRPKGSRYVGPREYLDNIVTDFPNGISFSHTVLEIGDFQESENGLETVVRLRVVIQPSGQPSVVNELNMVLAVLHYSNRSLSARIKSIDIVQPDLSAIALEAAVWLNVERMDTVEGYESYLKKFPEGAHAMDARRRLNILMDEAAWLEALKQNTVSGYETYLQDYPEGIFVDKARTRLNELQEQSPLPAPVVELEYNMTLVIGGRYKMGCRFLQFNCFFNETPGHEVDLSDFSISKYEVTQAQWEAVMGNNPSRFNTCPDCPVENVSWNEVQEFIRKLNIMTGGNYRLPTEAEWEYAASGGHQSKGFKYAGSNKLDSVAWYWENSGRRTHPVGTKLPNELGLYDMTGNVKEWCSDWYSENYYRNSDEQNPQGPPEGSLRVRRGGSWFNISKYCRVLFRYSGVPDEGDDNLGFRLAAE